MSVPPDYQAPAELYAGSRFRSGGMRYQRFPSAAEAIRYVMEVVSPTDLRGTAIEFDGDRYEGDAIQALYDAPGYPLKRAPR